MRLQGSGTTTFGRLLMLVAAATLLLAGCGHKASANPKVFRVRAGDNDAQDKNIAVEMFMPQAITVTVATQVVFVVPGPEPHTVTFVPEGQKVPAPNAPGALDPKPPVGFYDGRSLISSGLQPTGSKPGVFRVMFSEVGTFNFVDVIHPAMTGTVTVVAKGQKADTPKTLATRGKAELAKWLAEGRAAKKALIAQAPKSTRNPDGTTTWTISMGVSTQHTDVLAFHPTPAAIKPGDHVTFVNDTAVPHTASFAGTKSLPTNPQSPEAMKPAPGKSPQNLNPTDFFNTGWLPPVTPGSTPPLAARSFTFIVQQAGTYNYVCLLHQGSNMTGSIQAG
jgi:plastocyanin